MSKTVTLRIKDSVYQRLRILAERDNRPLSNYIETAALRYIEQEEYVDEFEMLVERYAPEEISFSDEVFTLKKKWAHAICDGIIRRGLHRKSRWFANGRVNCVDRPLLEKMRRAGCVRIGFGSEPIAGGRIA